LQEAGPICLSVVCSLLCRVGRAQKYERLTWFELTSERRGAALAATRPRVLPGGSELLQLTGCACRPSPRWRRCCPEKKTHRVRKYSMRHCSASDLVHAALIHERFAVPGRVEIGNGGRFRDWGVYLTCCRGWRERGRGERRTLMGGHSTRLCQGRRPRPSRDCRSRSSHPQRRPFRPETLLRQSTWAWACSLPLSRCP